MDICRSCLWDFRLEDSSTLRFDDNNLKKFLFPMRCPSTRRPVLCGVCTKSFQESALLVSNTSKTEAKIIESAKEDGVVVMDIKKLHAKVDALPSDLRSNVEVCRLCLQFIAKPKIFLCENDHNILPHTIIKDMLEFCNIRVDYEISEKPTMCSKCWELLQIAYTSKKNYMEIRTEFKYFSFKLPGRRGNHHYWNMFRQFREEVDNESLNESVPNAKRGVLDVNHEIRIQREHDYINILSANSDKKQLPKKNCVGGSSIKHIWTRNHRKRTSPFWKRKYQGRARVFSATDDATMFTIYLLVTENETKFEAGLWIKIRYIWEMMHPGKKLSYTALWRRTNEILQNKSLPQSEINRIKIEVWKELSKPETEIRSQSNEMPLLIANIPFVREIKENFQKNAATPVTSLTDINSTEDCLSTEAALPVLDANIPFAREVKDEFRSVSKKLSATSALVTRERARKIQKRDLGNVGKMPTLNAKDPLVQTENKVVQPFTSMANIISDDKLAPVNRPAVKFKCLENKLQITPCASASTALQKHLKLDLTNVLIRPSIVPGETAFQSNKDCTLQQPSEICMKNVPSTQSRLIGRHIVLNKKMKSEMVPLDNLLSLTQQNTSTIKSKIIPESKEGSSQSSPSSAGSNAKIDQIPPLVYFSQSQPNNKSSTTHISLFHPINADGNDSDDSLIAEAAPSSFMPHVKTEPPDSDVEVCVDDVNLEVENNQGIWNCPPLLERMDLPLLNPNDKTISLEEKRDMMIQCEMDKPDIGVEIVQTCRRYTYKNQPIGDGLFRCLECSFETKCRGSAETHSKWHSGKKKLHSCPECSYKIPNKQRMQKHMKLHKQENAALGLLQET